MNPVLTGWVRVTLAALLAVFVLYAQILFLNQGTFTYTLDDPYIHLALSERLAAGFYGLNPGEPASPSSSILYPFLLMAGAGQPWHVMLPLVLALIGLALALAALMSLFATAGLLATGPGRLAAEVLAVGLAFALNLLGVPFTGMEHTLHVAATLAALAGLARWVTTDRMPWWLAPVVLVNPLLRFEGLGVVAGFLAALLLLGRRWTALGLAAAVGGMLAGYGWAMHRLGLPVLPGSVMIKSSAAQAGGEGHVLAVLQAVLGNLATVWREQPSARLLIVAAGLVLVRPLAWLLVSLVRRREAAWRDPAWKGDGAVALLVGTAAAAHLAAGRYGWFGRYELYVLALAVAAPFFVWRRELGRLVAVTAPERAWPLRLAALAVLAVPVPLMLVWAAPHLSDVTRATPLAARNIYLQHYQMHRFSHDYFPEPVAVADLGYVAFGARWPVLDLRGLGSEPARRAQLAGRAPKDWIAELTGHDKTSYMMIYDVAFPILPDGWQRVGFLSMDERRVTAADSIVAFHANGPEAAARLTAALQRFRPTLPHGAALELAAEHPYRLGETVRFGDFGTSYRFIHDGWWVSEGDHTWTWGREANLELPLDRPYAGPVELAVDLSPYLYPGLTRQRVELSANGRPLARWEVSGPGEMRATLPAELLAAGTPLHLTLRLPDAAAPAAVSASGDDRLLGVAVRSLRLAPLPVDGGAADGGKAP